MGQRGEAPHLLPCRGVHLRGRRRDVRCGPNTARIDQGLQSNECFGVAVDKKVSRRFAYASVVQPRSTKPSHVGCGGKCWVLGHDGFWWHLYRDWLGDRVGLFSKTMGSPIIKPRDGFATFLIHTHLSARLTAPIGKHSGKCPNPFRVRL